MSSADRRENGQAGLGSARYGRRHFLRLAGGTAATIIGGTYLLGDGAPFASAGGAVDRTFGAGKKKYLQLVATDGFVSMPDSASAVGAIWPDNLAPTARNLYIFGFANPDVAGAAYPRGGNPNHATPPGQFWIEKGDGRSNVPYKDTSLSPGLVDLRGQAELSGPMIYFDEGDDVELTLTNLGLTQRPDLLDAHTIHWHGFPNQIPYFDGVPDSSLSVPVGRNLVYRYIIRQPGTFMYHCHVEDVEHVHMGLTGIVFIRPAQNAGASKDASNVTIPAGKYAVNDGLQPTDPNSTRYDREFAFILTEADVRDHWNDAHKQENDFTDYDPTFGLMNGRAYPDTLVATRPDYVPGFNMGAGTLAQWETANARLHRNPWSSVIEAKPGETVLLRFSDLGFKEHSMALPGLDMWVVARDSESLMAGRAGYAGAVAARADATWRSDVIHLGPGESRDVLVKVPASVPDGTVFHFYDRMDRFADGPTGKTPGSMRTEFRIRTNLPPQTIPHQSFSA